MKSALILGALFILCLATKTAWAASPSAKAGAIAIICPATLEVAEAILQEPLPLGLGFLTKASQLRLMSADIYSGPVEQLAVLVPNHQKVSKVGDVFTYTLVPALPPAVGQFNGVCDYSDHLLVLVQPLPVSVKQCTVLRKKVPSKVIFHCTS